jgi:hypothetical protein
MIEPVGFGPTEYRYVWHTVGVYQFVVLEEHTPYALTWFTEPSDSIGSQLLLQDVAPALGLVAGTETVSKESYRLHTVIIIYIHYDVHLL